MSKNEINTDKMVIGLLTTPLFMLGIVQLLIIPLGFVGAIFILNSPEVLFLKIAFCVIFGFAMFGAGVSGVENVKKGYSSWYRYRHSEDE